MSRFASRTPGGMGSTESAGVYRPRHPERPRSDELLEGHFERYLQVYEVDVSFRDVADKVTSL